MLDIFRPVPAADPPGRVECSRNRSGRLVPVLDYLHGDVLTQPVYALRGLPGAVSTMYLREDAAKRLKAALEYLPRNLTFKIFDAWRPLRVQQALYDEYLKKLKDEHPEWNPAKLEEQASLFVARPGTGFDAPAHNTGGAVDLSLCYVDNGRLLNMGTGFDDFTEKAWTDYFESDAARREPNYKEIRNNRRMLYGAMTAAGFTNLPSEWWHYDFWDGNWAWYMGKTTVYGGVERPQP